MLICGQTVFCLLHFALASEHGSISRTWRGGDTVWAAGCAAAGNAQGCSDNPSKITGTDDAGEALASCHWAVPYTHRRW